MFLNKAVLPRLLFALAPLAAHAQWEVETDPIAYGLKGFSAHVAHAAVSRHGRIQAGVFGADTPEGFHGNKGFTQSSRGVTLKFDHFLNTRHKGFFIGADGHYARVKYKLDATGASTSRNRWALGPRAGYRFEIGQRLYIVPWVSVSRQFNAKDVILSGKTFEEKNYGVFPTVHVGWRF